MNPLIQQQRYLIDFTLASLMRRPGKNLGLLLVYTLIVFLLASVMLFTHSLRTEAGHILQGSPEIVLQKMVAGRHDLIPASYLEKMGRIRGVVSKHGRLWGYFYDPAVKANYTLMVPRDRTLSNNQIIVGATIARIRGVGVGDYLALRSAGGKAFAFEVADILDAASELVTADLILLNEVQYREFFSIPEGYYTDLALRVRNPNELRKIAENEF